MRLGIRPLLAACLLALALVASACGNSGDEGGGTAPGVTKDSVTVGGHFPLTGPAAPGYSEIPVAIKAYFDYVNDNGGINGRQLKFVARDDAYNPTNTVKVTKQLVLEDKIFAMVGGLGTPTHTKVVDFLNSSKVPDLFVSSGCLCWDDPEKNPYTFGWLPEYPVEGKILGDYIKKNFPGKKVGVFYQDDDFGEGGLEGLEQDVEDQIVAREGYQPGNTDIGPQMAAIKRAGAEVVVLFTVPTYTALAHLAALELDFKPQFVATSVGTDPTTVGALLKEFSKGKAGTSLIEGLISDYYLPSPYDESDSWTKLFTKVREKYAPKLPNDGNVQYGMALAYTFADALQRAGDNPTRQSLIDAIEEGGMEGPPLAPYRYSKDSHAGITGLRMSTIKNGELQYMGETLTTDDGDQPIEEYNDGHPEAPADGIPPKE
jgi:ABC-type branched-subunit amino acid transport system substrate-binding protein